jgi:adenylosuccinate synthase
MPATIVMAGNGGTRARGKLTDALAAGADVVVRANGGSNAGHTIATERGVFKLHLSVRHPQPRLHLRRRRRRRRPGALLPR